MERIDSFEIGGIDVKIPYEVPGVEFGGHPDHKVPELWGQKIHSIAAGYDPYPEMIDDGEQCRAAEKRNLAIVAALKSNGVEVITFNTESSEPRTIKF